MNGVVESHFDGFTLKPSSFNQQVCDLSVLHFLKFYVYVFLVVNHFDNRPYFGHLPPNVSQDLIFVNKTADDIFQEKYAAYFHVLEVAIDVEGQVKGIEVCFKHGSACFYDFGFWGLIGHEGGSFGNDDLLLDFELV